MKAQKQISTRSGTIESPAFLPVTTYGGKLPLAEIVRPYLDRLAPALMVSHFYAQGMKTHPKTPVFIDSGGFASIFKESSIVDQGETAAIRTKEGKLIDPRSVLEFQCKQADVGATLDFLIPPGMDDGDACLRQDLTIRNAKWAIQNGDRGQLALFASIQAWDHDSTTRIMEELAPLPFDGFALGGMMPRVKTPKVIFEIVEAIRKVDKERPLHVFGIGQPSLIKGLFSHGVDSADSSSYLKYAVGKRILHPGKGTYAKLSEVDDFDIYGETVTGRQFDKDYLSLEGELNNMALTLHNLEALNLYLALKYPLDGKALT